MHDLLRMSRFSHYVKNIFVIPGVIAATLMVKPELHLTKTLSIVFWGLISISLSASANYVLNEYLDRKTDIFHPNKKSRPAAMGRVSFKIVFAYYTFLITLATLIALSINYFFALVITLFLFSGIFYNVEPIRLKDRYLLDVVSESFNNVLRFLAGWFLVTQSYLPPISLTLSYWWVGAFLMTAKRLAEIQSFDSIELAANYRLSFSRYSVSKLTSLTFLYACLALMSLSVFAVKWEPGSIFLIPILSLIFTYYFHVSNGLDSVAQNPEKLWKDKKLTLLIFIFVVQFYLVLVYSHTFFSPLVQSDLIKIVK